jgi:hypothetical protein
VEWVAATRDRELAAVGLLEESWPTPEQRRRIWLSVLLEAAARQLLPAEAVRQLLFGAYHPDA